ncbi:MAG: glycosyltransferase [Candidatus Moranbacteria bacterium]|nr:glycosyltransferase [Candidatus Moranbacteria bacterium]
MLRIGINASFLRKINTGLGQYSLNIIKSLLELNKTNKNKVSYYLYAEEKTNLDLIPENEYLRKKIVETVFYKRDDLLRKASWEKIFLPRAAIKDNVDIFFTPFNSASVFKTVRHVVTLHDMIWKVFESTYSNNLRKDIYFKKTFQAAKKADHIITVSEYSKKEIIKYLKIPSSRISVIYNGIEEEFRVKLSKTAIKNKLEKFKIDSPYIFYIGGFEKRKNVELLLKTFKRLAATYKNVLANRKLVLAGEILKIKDPLITDVKKIIAELEIQDKVVLTGKIKNKDRTFLYQGAEMFVYPSLYEGFGLPVAEAMASGCPVIAGSTSAIPEIGRTAIEYFNPNREDELIQRILSLISNKKKQEVLSNRGIERAKLFDWQKAAQKTFNVLTDKLQF